MLKRLLLKLLWSKFERRNLAIRHIPKQWIYKTKQTNKYLRTFLQVLLRSELRQSIIGQAIVQASKPRSAIMSLSFGLAAELDHVFGSKWFLYKLYKLGFCCSYTEATGFKHSAIITEDATQANVTLPSVTCSQHIADYICHNLCTLDRTNTFNGMEIIQVSPNDNGLLRNKKPVKLLGLQQVASLTTNKGIPIDRRNLFSCVKEKIFSDVRELKFDLNLMSEKNIDHPREITYTFSDQTNTTRQN